MITPLVAAVALFLDRWWGEPRRFHPLVGFGRLASGVERRLYRDSRGAGVLAWLLVVVPPVLLTVWLVSTPLRPIFEIVLLYLVIGWRALEEAGKKVLAALEHQDLPGARHAVAQLVSRDTADMDETQASAATLESLLENGNDAIFAPLFWFVVAGAPGAVLYRLANTLDAMWGYKTTRYLHFGWAAARLDDVLNYLPARLTVLSYALAGALKPSLQCAWTQGRGWKSPNAGPVMAAGAGALGIRLGGPACYQGQWQERPVLGTGRLPQLADIGRSADLMTRALGIWLAGIFIVWAVLEIMG